MDVLTIILLFAVIVLIIANRYVVTDKLRNLEFRIDELNALLRQQQKLLKPAEAPKAGTKTEAEPAPPLEAPKLTETTKPEPPKPAGINIPDRPKTDELKDKPVVERHPQPIMERKAPITPVKPALVPHTKPSFYERNPDLEKFIGENLVNKIGIAILVLAIGFFVKYAIDNNWIGPVGRVGIGILCGAILVAFAHKMRKSYKAFSSVLAGGGIAVFYFSITLAFQEFHLFSQLAALVIMIVITIFAVALALLYDKEELAIIGLLGGFASPFLLSNGTANYNGLLLYLFILNVGLLIIAYYKSWRILNISSFGLSVIVFATVLFVLPSSAYGLGLRYATIFYLLFFCINITNNVREKKAFIAIDFSVLLINTALYFGAGLYLLTEMGDAAYRGLFSAALAFLNLVLSYILFRKKSVDPNILYLLIGITLTFISLTAPIQLHGNNITLFWFTEAVLLHWLYQRSGIKMMRLTSLILWGLAIISLLMDIYEIYADDSVRLTLIANKGFITTAFGALGSYALYRLVKKDTKEEVYAIASGGELYRVGAIILLFAAGALEINHQFSYYYPNSDLNVIYLMLYLPVFSYLLSLVSAQLAGSTARAVSINIVLLSCSAGLYLLITPDYYRQLEQFLTRNSALLAHFWAHWLSDVVVALIFYRLVVFAGKTAAGAWLLSAAIVVFLSLEVCLVSEVLFYTKTELIADIQLVYVKTGLPILWGISSFVLMWLGMRNKQRELRIISLTLFGITLLKLFLFDIRNIPVGGKIAAFFCLGVLLLIVSFMYQKLKKIITDDGEKPKDE